MQVPLISLFGASNEMPQGNELEALWDRFLLRFRVGYITDTGFVRFIRAAAAIACASFFFNGGTVFEPWMKKALELVDESRFEKADVICIIKVSPVYKSRRQHRPVDVILLLSNDEVVRLSLF